MSAWRNVKTQIAGKHWGCNPIDRESGHSITGMNREIPTARVAGSNPAALTFL